MGRKQLSDFPRPPDDNGRGVHWSAMVYHPSGAALQNWIKELKALQIKWVKLLDDSGGSSIDMCRALLDNGIMPIVRLYRERPNPGHLDGRGVDAVRRLVAAGVRYFETNNEPDLPAEWQNNHRPPNWLDVVIDNFIWDADYILGQGGLPALPPMGPGSKDNSIAKVIDRGRKDLFERGAWVAIHNYTLNHPLNYPSDDVNQTGAPLTAEEYTAFQRWQYSHLTQSEAAAKGISAADYDKYQKWAWDGRSLADVNALRARAKNPGHTVLNDANCFRGFEWWGAVMEQALGFHVPVISTEGGPVVGWGDDKRYAKVNPATQAEWQMEIFRFLQDEAPDWYFTCCTWLLASRSLGDYSPTWDQMAWYTHAWDHQFGLAGELPLVRQMKETPSKVRRARQGLIVTGSAVVEGRVTTAAGAVVAGLGLLLQRDGATVATTQTDRDGRYRLSAPPGKYDLVADWVGPVIRAITLTEGDTDVFDLNSMDATGDFRIAGVVKDASGKTKSGVRVELQRNGIVQRAATSNASGAFEFRPAVAGAYVVTAGGVGVSTAVRQGQPAVTANITLPAVTSARYAVTSRRLLPKAETGNNRLFFGRVTDKDGRGLKDVELEMRWTGAASGTRFPRTRTGHVVGKPDPDGYFEFLHSPGNFSITIVQGDFPSDTAADLVTTGVPGREGDAISYEVNFQLQPGAAAGPARSVVRGKILGGKVGQVMTLWTEQESRKFVLDANRTFRFEGLPAGLYELMLAGVGTIRPDLVLDGKNEIIVDFPVLGAIIGAVENAPASQRSVSLFSETYGFSRFAELTPDQQYRFTNLPAGTYRVEMGDDMVAALTGDGKTVLRAPVLRIGAGVVTPAAESRISGIVRSAAGQPMAAVDVTLQSEGKSVATSRSDSAGVYQFEKLVLGYYRLVVNGEVLASDLYVDGRSSLTVDLIVQPPESPKPLSRYYLLGMADADLQPALLRLVAPWLATQPPGAVGFSSSEAGQAATVVLLGDGIGDAAVAALREAGCQVVDLRKNLLALAALLSQRPAQAPAPGSVEEVSHA